jgi:cytochrome P450
VTTTELSPADLEATLLSLWSEQGGHTNPYPIYERLRTAAPVYFNPNLGAYFLTRYADIESVLTSQDFRTPDGKWADQTKPGWRDRPGLRFMHTSLLYRNGDDHTWMRRLVNRGFTARRVQAQQGAIETAVTRVLDELEQQGANGGVVDFQEIVGFPLPVSVIGDMIGVPQADQSRFRWLVDDIAKLFDPVLDEESQQRADDGTAQVRDYFADLIAQRRRQPLDDLISVLIGIADEDERLTDDDIVDLAALVFGAGFETTTGLIGNATHALLTRRDQSALLIEDPANAAGVFDEALRWNSSAQMVMRVAGTDTEIDGHAIPADSVVIGFIGAANHDPATFDQPDTFEIRRRGIRPLSLGAGAHFCLGGALAKLQTEVLFARLFQRFPKLALAGHPVRRKTLAMRGFDSLPVTVTS